MVKILGTLCVSLLLMSMPSIAESTGASMATGSSAQPSTLYDNTAKLAVKNSAYKSTNSMSEEDSKIKDSSTGYSMLKIGAAAAIGAVAAPFHVGPALGAIGFTAFGPAGIAAGVQAGIGNVAAGGVFATLQGAAMGGAALAPLQAGAAVAGGAVGAGVGAVADAK